MYTEKYFYRKVETSNILFFSITNTKGPPEAYILSANHPWEQLAKDSGPH